MPGFVNGRAEKHLRTAESGCCWKPKERTLTSLRPNIARCLEVAGHALTAMKVRQMTALDVV